MDYPGPSWPEKWPLGKRDKLLSLSEKLTNMVSHPFMFKYFPSIAKYCHEYYSKKYTKWENTIIFAKRILKLLYDTETGNPNTYILSEVDAFQKIVHRHKYYTTTQLASMIHTTFQMPIKRPKVITFRYAVCALAWSDLCSKVGDEMAFPSLKEAPIVSIYDSFEVTLDQFVMVFHTLMYSIIRIAFEHLYVILQDNVPKKFTLLSTEKKTPFCAYYVDFALLWVSFADVINGLNSVNLIRLRIAYSNFNNIAGRCISTMISFVYKNYVLNLI
jgi:hypothetical protein